jgi:hypothetical protein
VCLEGDGSVLKKVPVNQLTVGMFVHGFDESWLKHPFWRSKFLIKEAATLREVQASGIPNCWIDVSKGQDVHPDKPREAAAAAPVEKRRPSLSVSPCLKSCRKPPACANAPHRP